MMQQYQRIKGQHKDAVLFFRLGDFYEMFNRDAEEVSRILSLTLTQRHGIPMCGIPYHAAQGYIARLLKQGKKIAVCEQVSLPEKGKGLARREVVEIITPGTVTTEELLDQGSNNYLMAVYRTRECLALAYADLSTGEWKATAFPGENPEETVRREVGRLQPREILCQESLQTEFPQLDEIFRDNPSRVINPLPDWSFSRENSWNALLRHFQTVNLKAFGLKQEDPAVIPAGSLLEYIQETSRSVLPHMDNLERYSESSFVTLDESTQRNLEILRSMQTGGERYTLHHVLDETRTAMGQRLLKQWLLHPLKDASPLQRRLDAVEFLHHNQVLLAEAREKLKAIRDLQRLSSRLAMEKAHAKDLLAIADSLSRAAELADLFKEGAAGGLPGVFQGDFLLENGEGREQLRQLARRIRETLVDEPSILLSEGKLIREGVDQELDQVRNLRDHSRDYLEEYRREVMEKTGLPRLKIRYNKILGYFFEVTKANLDKVPEDFIRRQSLVNAERFTTEKLSETEDKINNAWEESVEKEKALFLELRREIRGRLSLLQETSRCLAAWDVLQSLAYTATIRGYVRPRLKEEPGLKISEGRHPVVEAHMETGEFIPNGIRIGAEEPHFALITGPNMAGKSTYLRQTALIALMAQCGSYVPAAEAEIGLVDKIFCRVGASDNLARGESTFLVEMNETAHILRTATRRSLIIMDEVGRGTSTLDGLSLARAVSEYLMDKVGSCTLFATHYHELTGMVHPELRNLSLAVREYQGRIVFLKNVQEGPSSRSYGIHVARLAGLPPGVIERAGKLLQGGETAPAAASTREDPEESRQPTLFPEEDPILMELKSLDPDELTPRSALETLYRWKKQSKGPDS